MRKYPKIEPKYLGECCPISFITVHFSDEYFHNLIKSPCVLDKRNQLVTVDNRFGHRFDALSAAINTGLDQAIHDLVVVVHEDVFLPVNWDMQLHQSLERLSAKDPDWGMAGSVGWDQDGKSFGHWSDPHKYRNSLDGRDFVPVARLDEQILIFRKSVGLRFDELLPSIHNIGHTVASKLAAMGRKTYAINAPTIHKYADENGRLIQSADESSKLTGRWLPTNVAEWKCSDTYLRQAYPEWQRVKGVEPDDLSGSDSLDAFGPPVIGLARGGSGSGLLCRLLQDLGYFMGWGLRWKPHPDNPKSMKRGKYVRDKLPPSGDAEFIREAVYRAVFSTLQTRADWQRAQVVARLRCAANRMLSAGTPRPPWGFKMPENLLILPELDQAFPNARYIHFIRDPLAVCLQNVHMNASLDNAIGRVAVRAAYRHFDRPLGCIPEDSPSLRMAYTTRHQIEIARTYAASDLQGRYLEIRFEDLLESPVESPGRNGQAIADWLGRDPVAKPLADIADPQQGAGSSASYDERTVRDVTEVLRPLRQALNYA